MGDANDLSLSTAKRLGFAKVKWNKRYFCVINGILYMFKEDVYAQNPKEPILRALKAWDLQIIDCVLDDNGKRSGSKFAVLVINGAKTYFLKFGSGPEAVVFYSQLKQCWTDTRGNYYVDFSTSNGPQPVIMDEANGPQPIQQDISVSLSLKKKSSVYLPNPSNGGALTGAKEQDAIILNLISEYEKKQSLKKKRNTTAALNLASEFADDFSSTGSFEEFADESVKFDASEDEEDEESDDPLYRQVSKELAQKQSKQPIEHDNDEKNEGLLLNGHATTKRMPPPPKRRCRNDEAQAQKQKKEDENNEAVAVLTNDEIANAFSDKVNIENVIDEDVMNGQQREEPKAFIQIESNGANRSDWLKSTETMQIIDVAPNEDIEMSKSESERIAVDDTNEIEEVNELGVETTNEFEQNEENEQIDTNEAHSLNETEVSNHDDNKSQNVLQSEENDEKQIEIGQNDDNESKENGTNNDSTIEESDANETEFANHHENESENAQSAQNEDNGSNDDDAIAEMNESHIIDQNEVNQTANTQQSIEQQHNEIKSVPDHNLHSMAEEQTQKETEPLSISVNQEQIDMAMDKMKTLTPKQSETDDIEETDVSSAISEAKPIKNEPESPQITNKQRKKPRALSNVSAQIESFNQKNDEIKQQRHGTPKTVSLSPAAATKKPKRRRRRKKKKHEATLSSTMSHLKLTRWFKLDKSQLIKFNSPSFKSSLEKQLEKLGILSLDKGKKLIKVQISRRIPLPKRAAHWTTLLETLQTKLAGHSLLDSETVG